MDWWDEEPDGYPKSPPRPEAARSRAFSYDAAGLQVHGFNRAPLSELKLLFRANASSSRRAAATKPWVSAQLRLYGIPFASSATAAVLKDTLKAAVKGGKCVDDGPPSVAAVEERLAAQYNQNLRDHERALKKHKQDVAEWHEQEFAKLDSPTREANYDLDMFMAKYFFDEKGLPAPAKTPEPVIIWDPRNYQGLCVRVERVPGLRAHICYRLAVVAWASKLEMGIDTAFAMIDKPDVKCDRPTLEACFDADRFLAKYFLDGRRGKAAPQKQITPITLDHWFTYEDRLEKLLRAAQHVPELAIQETSRPLHGAVLCCVLVGWPDGVHRQVEAWGQEIAKLKAEKAEREIREKLKSLLSKLKPHIDYSKAHPCNPGLFTLENLQGSYLVHCPFITKENGISLDEMTLDVQKPTSPHGTVAAFNFGMINGTMLLAMSEDALHSLREELSVRPSDDEVEDEGWYEMQESSRISRWDSHYIPETRKRKRAASQSSRGLHIKRRLGGGPSHPGRIYLQWAGCETYNSHLVLDDEDERMGYLDIDLSGVSARGQFQWKSLEPEKMLDFAILKVSDTPGAKPDEWSSYCEKERWIRW